MRKTETGQKIKTGNGVLGVCGNGRLGVSSFVLPLNSADACILRSGVSVGKLAHICPIKAYHILLTEVSQCVQREWDAGGSCVIWILWGTWIASCRTGVS